MRIFDIIPHGLSVTLRQCQRRKAQAADDGGGVVEEYVKQQKPLR